MIKDFIQMGGYGFYVWMSYGFGLIMMVLMAVIPMIRCLRLISKLSQTDRNTHASD